MAEVVLFHHAQGLTAGVYAFADELRVAGHTVHTPDSYDGHTFRTLEEGFAYAHQLGSGEIVERGLIAAEALSSEVVYAGISLGVMPAQLLAQTEPGAVGGVFISSCIQTWAIGKWQEGVPAQVHAMNADPIFVEDGDLTAAHDLVAMVPGAELFLYQGDQHLFVDSSLNDYNVDAYRLLMERLLRFLEMP